MWRNRFDDLWLWPIPGWFVRVCNRLGGAVVLDVIAILLLLAVAGIVYAICRETGVWLVWVSGIMFAPAALLVTVTVVNGLIRRMVGMTPAQNRQLQEDLQRDKARLQNLELLKRGKTAFCDRCGGELGIAVWETDRWFRYTVSCQQGCPCWEFHQRKEL
jgi:hypothetical protein